MAAVWQSPDPSSPMAMKKSFADVLSSTTATTTKPQLGIPIKEPTIYRGKPAVFFEEDEIESMAAPYRYALIGKFSHGRPSMVIIRQKVAAFGLKGAYTIALIDAKHIVINLRLEEDYARLWIKSVWYVDQLPMRIFKWTINFHPRHESSIAPVWINFPFLPLHLFNKYALYSIANLIGNPLKIDETTANVSRPRLTRVCMEFDVSKKLVEVVWIGKIPRDRSTESSDGFLQDVVYEFVPYYCSSCYHVGHQSDSCLRRDSDGNPSSRNQSVGEPKKINQSTQDKGKSIMESERPTDFDHSSGLMHDAMKDSEKDLHLWLNEKRHTYIVHNMQVEDDQILSKQVLVPAENAHEVGNDVALEEESRVSEGLMEEVRTLEGHLLEEHTSPLVNPLQLVVVDSGPPPIAALPIQLSCALVSETVNEPVASEFGKLNVISKDDLMLLQKNLDGDDEAHIEAIAGPLAHPHVHSRRKSDGDGVTGLEDLIPLQDLQAQCNMGELQNDNLRRSTRQEKLTFKVRKSPPRY